MSFPASIGRGGEAAPSFDTIVIELIRNSFHSICDEMFELVVRSSHSPNIKERRDCSCCLYAPSGEMVVQAEHIPIHLGTMPQALRAILAQYPAETMRPGDAFVVNDPYHGGNHLPDLVIAGPMFLDGVLVGFAASMAHHTDVGGMTPRSMPASAVEIFQEGLRIPPVRLAENGVILDDVMRLVALNSRLPAERRTDVQAQLSSLHIAQRRIMPRWPCRRKEICIRCKFAISEIKYCRRWMLDEKTEGYSWSEGSIGDASSPSLSAACAPAPERPRACDLRRLRFSRSAARSRSCRA